jgi:hypothetical protein
VDVQTESRFEVISPATGKMSTRLATAQRCTP